MSNMTQERLEAISARINIRCIFGSHDDEYLYSIHRGREQVFKCRRCGKYFIFAKHLNIGYRTWVKPVESVEIPRTGIGDLSDGYHTFNELYYHRAVLFSVICNQNHELGWKSKLHHDGTMYDGDFIVGIETPYGMVAYHYGLDLWDLFGVKELPRAPEWDGYKPTEAIERLRKYGGAAIKRAGRGGRDE